MSQQLTRFVIIIVINTVYNPLLCPQIISVATENCSSVSSCNECVSMGDPLCGWCVLEGKCSRSSSCMDDTLTGRYLTQGQQDSCIDRITIEPSEFVRDLEDEPYEV